MKRLILLLAVEAVAAWAAPVTIDIFPTLAPKAFGSPSWGGWVANATYALENGLSSYGDPNSPTYYSQESVVPGSAVMVTSYNSWMGVANPGAVFGAAFANELGNRLHFGVVMNGHGDKISASQISFSATSDDPNDILGFSFAAGTYEYSSSYIGVILNPDGSRTYVTSGLNTQPVDMIIGRGSGNALWPCAPDDPRPCTTLAEQQAALNHWANYNGAPWHLAGTYTLSEGATILAQASSAVTIDAVPEPSTAALLLAGLAGLIVARVRAAFGNRPA